MVDACHLHSWTVYVKKFMPFYAKKPAENFRPPSVLEAEAAGRAVLEEVFQLCFFGHTLSDALSHVIVDRDMLRHVLVERPKISKVDKPDKPPSPSGLPPLLRRPGNGKWKPLDAVAAGRVPAKRMRNGECWDGLKGVALQGFAGSSMSVPFVVTSHIMRLCVLESIEGSRCCLWRCLSQGSAARRLRLCWAR